MSDKKEQLEPTSVTRTPRGSESRETSERRKPWKPARRLPDPEEGKHPGLDHRWVRISARNEADNLNYSQARRDGWTPVKAVEYPELMVDPTLDPETRFPENVFVGGLLLCSRPKEIGDQVREYRDNEVLRQMHEVETSYMSEDDKRMKKFADNETRVSRFGS